MSLHAINVQAKTKNEYFCLDLCKKKEYFYQTILHCNAKCIYKYLAQEVRMNDTNLTNSNSVMCPLKEFFAPASLDFLLILKFNCL